MTCFVCCLSVISIVQQVLLVPPLLRAIVGLYFPTPKLAVSMWIHLDKKKVFTSVKKNLRQIHNYSSGYNYGSLCQDVQHRLGNLSDNVEHNTSDMWSLSEKFLWFWDGNLGFACCHGKTSCCTTPTAIVL